jgi:hypothetical protein
MAAPRRENDPKRQPRVSEVRDSVDGSWSTEGKIADFINAKKLNIIDGSKGQTVGGNLAHAADLAVGKGSKGREKSLRKTHMNVTGSGGADATAYKMYDSYEKYGDKYGNKND